MSDTSQWKETMLQSHPDIMDGAACIIGTRIPVTAVWSFAAAGYGPEAIREEYPSLTLSQIEAVIGKANGRLTDDQDTNSRGNRSIIRETDK